MMRLGSSPRLLLGFLLGAVAGVLLGERANVLLPLADLFVVGLKALGPLVALLALISALSSFRPDLGRLAVSAAGIFLLAALAAAVIGTGVALLLDVGRGYPLVVGLAGTAESAAGWPALLSASIHGPWTYALVFAVFVWLHLRTRGHDPRSTALVWRPELGRCLDTAYRMLAWLMQYAPIGIFALMAITFGRLQVDVATALLKLLLAVYLGQVLVFAGSLLALRISGLRTGVFLLQAREALLTALVTGSSAACVSLEFAVAEQRFGIARDRVGLVLPLGLGIYKPGTAVYLAVVILFAAQAAGHEFALPALLAVTLLALAASVVTPPVSGGSWVALGLVFAAAGLPPEAIAVAAAVPLLGKLNTPLNSLGRLAGLRMVAGGHAELAKPGPVRDLAAPGASEQS